jgi:hypothetical protein
MDLYGGTPGRFHPRGMSGTPKDSENLAMIQSFITSASNTFVVMVQGLDLRALIEADPMLASWYKGRVGANAESRSKCGRQERNFWIAYSGHGLGPGVGSTVAGGDGDG